jgi:peptidoglycan/LPS O-acetylase OafA/YrhL
MSVINPANPARQRLAVGLQWTGLIGAVLGVLATPFFGLGLALQWLIGGGVAIALDVVAIRTEVDVRRMLAALVKLVILVGALFVLTPSGTIPGPQDNSVPADLGPILLLLSVLPSEAGAMLRRTAPMPEMGVPHEFQQ